ncbi:TIGR03089 family protein, partial [Dietzia schimae]|nr:TIGR03089 family protein [Dietzia kunjamensis subsp. schimae]
LVAGSDRDDVVQVLARVFASGGTAVLVTGADADDPAVADVAATERTTLTL